MKTAIAILALAAAAVSTVGSAQQRDPAYAAARSAGQVGEQPDGYLGIVGAPTPALRALVNDINIRRKSAYTQGAASGATVEQFAFVSGCRLVAATAPGEMYQTPSGIWKQRGAGAPERDARCV
jgi:uncharacterized protein YdbL (DUF1318 family)